MSSNLFVLLLAGMVAIVAVAVAILVVVALARRARRDTPQSVEDAALGILRERYARGEIGQEEYQCMREDLMQDRNA